MSRYRSLDEWIEDSRGERSEDECWPWAGALNERGYGRIRVARVEWKAHRLVWTERVGDIPDGHDLGHLCHDRAFQAGECTGGLDCLHRRCVNYLGHLEPQTRPQNRRGVLRSHCLRCGQELSGSNLYVAHTARDGDVRRCASCVREQNREYTRR